MEFEPGGWRIDLEDFEELNKIPNESPVLAMRGTYTEITLDPREVIVIPNQRNQGSCQGHALTTCMEWSYCIASGASDVQLSRAAAYYLSQELDGIRSDSGSTVNSGIRLATSTGVAEEKYWPYPDRYNPAKPKDWAAYVENAKKYQIRASFKMTTYDGIATFIGSGQGGVEIGIGWNRSMERAVVESYSPGGGGHALAFIALSDRKDSQGRSYIWMANSWGSGWGNKGWAEVSPTAVQQMLSDRFTVMIGLSDMPNIKPRKFDVTEWKSALRA